MPYPYQERNHPLILNLKLQPKVIHDRQSPGYTDIQIAGPHHREVHGIGYRVFIPLSTFYDLADEGSSVFLNIFTAVREDAIHLYGFRTPEEKNLFELLLSVNGIGPKLAINLLSGIASADFIRAVFTEDRQTLTKIPGVGKKMAERIILELRDRVIKLAPGRSGKRSSRRALSTPSGRMPFPPW